MKKPLMKKPWGAWGWGQLEKEHATMARVTINTFTLPSSAAPGFHRMKLTRATTNTFNNNNGSAGGGGGGGGDQPCAWRRSWW